MEKIFTIIKREYREAVFKKSFIIMTLLTPIIMIAMGIVPSLLVRMDIEEPTVLSILDESGIIADKIPAALDDSLKDGTPRFVINMLQANSDTDQIIEAQKENINSETIDGFLVIPKDIVQGDDLKYYSKNVANFDLNRRLQKIVSTITIDHRLQNSGFDHEVINELTKSVGIKTIKITKEGEESERGFIDEFFSTFIFVLILYVTLIMYGMSIMRSIIQEKTTRIIEVLLSSANPFQIMAGKILGQGSVGLTQYIIWVLFGMILIFFGARMMPVSADAFNFSPEVLLYFILFYLLGYFLFSTMYTGVGAITNTDQEAQQAATPITFMLIIPLILISFMVKNPDSTIVQVLSYIPFFSPIIMFARINLATPSIIEIWTSVLILVVTIVLMIFLVAKIYRVGILMYGKRPTLPEIMKWIRL